MRQQRRGDGAGKNRSDEDGFVVPEAWASLVHARRGGLTGAVTPVDRRAVESVRRRTRKLRAEVEAGLDHERSNKELAAAGWAYLEGKRDPLGAAVTGALTWSLSNWDEEKCEDLTDAWAAAHGLPFAAAATVELGRVLAMYWSKRETRRFVEELDDDTSAGGFEDIEGAARRTRALLAVADEAEYREAVAELTLPQTPSGGAPIRRYQYQRVICAYLVPERTEWLDELLTSRLPVEHARQSPMLLGAVSSGDQLARLLETQHVRQHLPKLVHTLAEGVGPALVPTLTEMLDPSQRRLPLDERRAVYDVLAAMPGDAAFDALASRIGQLHVQEPVLRAAERFPVRSLRRLAAGASGGSQRAKLTRRALHAHLTARRHLVNTVVPELERPQQNAVRRALRGSGWVPEAKRYALPSALVDPVWAEEAARHREASRAHDELDVHLLPQVLLRSREHALPTAATRNLITLLVLSEDAEGTQAGRLTRALNRVGKVCDPHSLDDFVWAVFQQRSSWKPWLVSALKRFGGEETARGLVPLIRSWPRQHHAARAVTGVEVLAAIGGDVALMHLHRMARSSTHASVRKAATNGLKRRTTGRGARGAELPEWFVPHFGLDRDGGLTLDYGRRRFAAGFDERLRPFVTDDSGRRRTGPPRPGVRDDQVLAPLAHRRFAGLKKDVRTIAADQIQFLELAMVGQRRWRLPEFRARFADHPLLWHIARRLVWRAEEDGGAVRCFRIAEDRTLADVDDDTLTLSDGATVGVAHPLDVPDLDAWRELFADYELLQPFAQLDRTCHPLTDEHRDRTDLAPDGERPTVPTHAVLSLIHRGWQRGAPESGGVVPSISREVPGDRFVVIGLEPGIPAGNPLSEPEQTVSSVRCQRAPGAGKEGAPFGELDPVSFSEVYADWLRLTTTPR